MTYREHGRRRLYRSRNGLILGVCRGIADAFDISALWVRLFAVLALFFTGIWPTAVLYFAAAFLLKPEPVNPIHGPEEQAFYDAYTGSRTSALHSLKRLYDSLERRLRRLEDRVTGKEYDWDRRFNGG